MYSRHNIDYIGLAENFSLSASDARLLIVHGPRQHDRFVLTLPDGSVQLAKLENLIHQALQVDATWLFDSTDKTINLLHGNGQVRGLPENVQQLPQSIELQELLRSFQDISTTDNKYVLVIESEFLFEDPSHPTGRELELLRFMEKFCRQAPRYLTIVLKSNSIRSIPNALISSPFSSSIALPLTNLDERYAYVELRGEKLAAVLDTEIRVLASLISGATDQWNLHRVDRLIEIAVHSCANVSDVETLAQTLMTGVSKSPWMGSNIVEVVRNSAENFNSRIKGQPAAIEAVITTLKRSVTGLSASTQSDSSTAPKGVFFFAGPTGTGKTELSKSLATMIYGSESNIIRFDCGELQQEHSVQRLIGAPPGYVGYEAGGELTDAVAANPSCVILFDEIEKAHSRLLDTLLSVLDDGRLTNGQGQVTYFSDALIIFTSNSGMHSENEFGHRKLCYPYNASFGDMQTGIRETIAEEFKSKLKRPELLGRLGGKENIVVFDYIRDIEGILSKFINNISTRLLKLHKLELEVSDEVISQLTSQIKDDEESLSLGGRGISQILERFLINPLADWLFGSQFIPGKLLVSITENGKLTLTHER